MLPRGNTMAVRMAEREVGLVDERLVHETLAILTCWNLCWRWGPCCPGRTQLL